MLDTGSTVSLLNSKNVTNKIYEKMPSEKVQINTIEGLVKKNTEYVKTSCPEEFRCQKKCQNEVDKNIFG